MNKTGAKTNRRGRTALAHDPVTLDELRTADGESESLEVKGSGSLGNWEIKEVRDEYSVQILSVR